MSEAVQNLREIMAGVRATEAGVGQLTQQHLDSLVKPPGGLGRIEEVAVQLAAISGQMRGDYAKKCSILMCADNGVAQEGISSVPIVFTRTQTINFTKGYTGAAVLHKQVGADLLVVDIGVDADMSMIAGIYHKSMRRGTDNAAHGPAMSYEEAARAMLVGVEMVQEARALGYQVVGTGEMSAGNTTTAAAIIAAICGCLPVQTVGRGAGLSEAAYLHKVEIVAQMLAVNQPDPHDALDVLAKVGGFDIAGLAGVFLGAAYYRMPVVLDGLISIAAALVACRLQPKVREFIIPSHAGYELGFGVAARALGITPFFNLDMRFGEATGCPMTFNLIDLAGAVMRNMATLAEAGTPDEYVRQVASFEF